MDAHQPDFSLERRERVLGYTRERLLPRVDEIGDDALLLAVVGVLICDDNGFVSKEAVDAAVADPSVIQVAEAIVAEAKSLG